MCENISYPADLSEPKAFISTGANCTGVRYEFTNDLKGDFTGGPRLVTSYSLNQGTYSGLNDNNLSTWVPPHMILKYWSEPNETGIYSVYGYGNHQYTNYDPQQPRQVSSVIVDKVKSWDDFKADCCLMDESKDAATSPELCKQYWGDAKDNVCSRQFMVDYCANNYKSTKCNEWVRKLRAEGKGSITDAALEKYCFEVNPIDPDCKCVQASEDVEVQQIKQTGIRAPVECWYQPCTDIGNKDYMMTSTQLDKTCVNVDCSMENVTIDVNELSGELQNSIKNNCGILESGETVQNSSNTTDSTTNDTTDTTDTTDSATNDEDTTVTQSYSITNDDGSYNITNILIIGGVIFLILLLLILLV